MATITVYFDGKCGLCAKEIAHYARIAPDGVFRWVDITVDPDAFIARGFRVSEGLKLLHAQREDERMHVGVDAFILIWQQLPRWQWLAIFAALPVIRPIANYSYAWFARWRFGRLRHCQLALEQEKL